MIQTVIVNECIDKQQIVVEVPGNIEVGPLKSAKFVEVRGLCGDSGEIVMREYTDLK